MVVESPDPTFGPPQGIQVQVAGPSLPPRATRRERLRIIGLALLRSPTFVIGLVIVLFWVLDAIYFSLGISHLGQDPYNGDLLSEFQRPSAAHWFGTDDLGRDIFIRVLAGASSVLSIAPAATVLGLVGGIALGLITGYYRGIVDDIVMRLVDALLAFPVIIVAVLVFAVLGHSVLNVIIVIGIIFTPLIARTVRSAVLVEREREYVASARLLGEPGPLIMVREILPNIIGTISVEATVRLGYAIFTTATLSFLGLGVQRPSPDWGLAISLGRTYLQVAPWMVLFPAIALATLVVALNFLTDGLREVLED